MVNSEPGGKSQLSNDSLDARKPPITAAMGFNRSSGTKEYSAPVSTQNSSTKKRVSSAGFVTRTLTLNIPMVIFLNVRQCSVASRRHAQPAQNAADLPEVRA
jgi:hypothetical protein